MVDSHFASSKVVRCTMLLSKFQVRRALGQESHQDRTECYCNTPARKNTCELYSNTINHTEGRMGSLCVSLFSHISCTASLSAQNGGFQKAGGASTLHFTGPKDEYPL